MSFNLDKWKSRRDDTQHVAQKKAYAQNRDDWPFVSPNHLAEGTFTLRFLPPWPERCPELPFHAASHTLELTPGDNPERRMCWCLGEDGQDCYLCDFLEACRKGYDSYPEHVRKQLGKLSVWRRAVFPAVLGASREEGGDGLWIPRDRLETPVLLTVNDDTVSVVEMLEDAIRDFPDLSDPQTGRQLKVVRRRGNKYDLRVGGKAQPLSLAAAALYTEARYPRVVTRMTKTTRKTYEEQEDLLRSAWWAKRLFAEEAAVAVDDEETLEVPF